MRRTLLVLLVTLPLSANATDIVYEPEATDAGITYNSETDSRMFLTCGNDYVSALPTASIGYPIKVKDANNGTLIFQVIASGLASPPFLSMNMDEHGTEVIAAAKDNGLFAVFEAIKGQPDAIKLTVHGRLNGICDKILGPATLTGAKNFPSLVQQMANENWNR